MLEVPFLEWLVQQTGPVVALVLALWWQQQNHKAYVERERENAETHRQDKLRLANVLERVVESNTELRTLINEMRHELYAVEGKR